MEQIFLPSPATSEVSVTANLPTANCLCPEAKPPQILPGISDTAVQVELPKWEATDEWVSLMTGYSSVDSLKQASFDTRKQLEHSQPRFQTTQQAEAGL